MLAKLFKSDFVNPNVINIFTDASMMPTDGTQLVPGCYGFLTMHGEVEINQGLFVDTYSTVNRSEIKGIKCAVLEAIRLRNMGFRGIINIFSDSQISVNGIRAWIFGWKNKDNELFTKDGKSVANQSEYIEIMQLIIQYNPYVNFYHLKGHVDIHDPKNVYKATGTFKRSNMADSMNIEDIDPTFIKFISNCNNQIDNLTRWHLRNQIRPEGIVYRDAFKFVPQEIYENQIHTYNLMTGGNYNV